MPAANAGMQEMTSASPGGRFGGHHRGGGRGGRLGRVFDHGDLRYVLLQLIAERPRYGYELIKTIEEQFGGMYSPSPGVVYPTLTLLEELGYVRAENAGNTKRLYSVTEEGTNFLTANRALVDAIFARMAEMSRAIGGGPAPEIRRAVRQFGNGVVDPARQRSARCRTSAGDHPGARSRRGERSNAFDRYPRSCPMKLAVPDLVSNSYFPAVAAVELGFFAAEGLDMSLELVFPVDRAYREMRDGNIDFVGGSAHSALAAFPEWEGAKLLCAQAQGMYWFFVMRADLGARRGDVGIVKGKTIGAAPWVDMGLRRLLTEAGIDPQRDRVTIAPVPGAAANGGVVNFGLTAAKALEDRLIDGFWANGMGAEIAVRRGVGTVVLDVRRGDGPKPCFNYTMSALATTDRLIDGSPEVAAAAVRALVRTQAALKADPARATEVGRQIVPA